MSVHAENDRQLVYDYAEKYHELGLTVIPIQTGTKEPPAGFRWGEYRHRRPDASERYRWFIEQGHQVAVLAGDALTPLDFDSTGGYESILGKFPVVDTFPRVRTGSDLYHLWIKSAEPTRKFVAQTPNGGRLEVRAGVHYTLAPPSLHPSGKRYEWEQEPWDGIPVVSLKSIGLEPQERRETPPGEPVDTEGEPLTERELEEIVRILEPEWNEGQRTDLTLALAGWLASSQTVPIQDTRTIVERLIDAAPSAGDDAQQYTDFTNAIHNSYRKTRAGEHVAGWSALKALLPNAALHRLELVMRSRQPTFRMVEQLNVASESPYPYIISVADLLAEPDEPEAWLVEGLVRAQSIGLTVGPPKTFKSFFEQEIQLAMATGTRAFGQWATGEPRVCVHVQEESSRNAWRRRWRQLLLGKDIPPEAVADTLYTVTNQGLELDNADSMRRFIDEVMRKFEPEYITLDPLREMHSQDENSSQDMRPILKLLKQIRDEFEVAIQLVHHNNKNPNYDNPFDSIRGSTSIWGAMDAGIFVMRTDNDTVMKVKPLLKEGGQADPFLYTIQEVDGGIVLNAMDMEGRAKKVDAVDVVTWARQRGDWWPIDEAIGALPASERTVRNAVRDAVKVGQLKERAVKFGKKMYAHQEVSDDDPSF